MSICDEIFSDSIDSNNSLKNELLAKNLCHLMHIKKIDPAKLSKEIGIALSTINGLRRGVGNPTLSTLCDLSRFFKVSIGDLTEQEISSIEPDNSQVYELPILELEEIDDFFKKRFRSKKTITTELENTSDISNIFCIKIKNHSMMPFFEKNTIFVIFAEKHVHDGDMVLVKFKNNMPCIRQIFIEGNSYFFKPITDNPDKNAINTNEFKIIGIVVKAIQTLTDR